MIPDECKMDATLKELAKLEKLTADGKAKSPSIDQTLDTLLSTLRAEQERIQSGNASPETFEGLATKVESLKKDLDDRQKEIYNSLSRYGKALDKVRPRHLPSMFIGKSQLHPPTEIPKCFANLQPALYFHQGLSGFGPYGCSTLSPNRSVHNR